MQNCRPARAMLVDLFISSFHKLGNPDFGYEGGSYGIRNADKIGSEQVTLF